MAMYSVKSESLTAVADAIRAKTGGADLLAFPEGMVEAIGGISGGGGDKGFYAGSFGIDLSNTVSVFAPSGFWCANEVYAGTYTNNGSAVIE